MKPNKIAIFGGSFDPPHLGHLAMAQAAVDQTGVDEVLFIPCAISPHKESSPPASGSDRLNMLKLATDDLPWATVSDIDLQLPSPSFTWRTIEALQSQLAKDTQLHWIMGADQWNNLKHWARPDFLRDHLHFLVLPRENAPISPKEGWKLSLINAVHPASSSAIRKAIHRGENSGEWTDWLHPAVYDYIITHQLYQS